MVWYRIVYKQLTFIIHNDYFDRNIHHFQFVVILHTTYLAVLRTRTSYISHNLSIVVYINDNCSRLFSIAYDRFISIVFSFEKSKKKNIETKYLYESFHLLAMNSQSIKNIKPFSLQTIYFNI